MKLAYSVMIGAALLCLTICCNKKNDPRVKSVEELVKGKAWSGDLLYSTQWTEQPFYVQFNSNNTQFIWTEASGVYPGNYAIDEAKRQFILTFSSGSTVTLTIDNNEKVSDINYGGVYNWKLQNVEQNSTARDSLDNTFWKGVETPELLAADNNSTLSFKPGAALNFSTSTGTGYSRSGSVIKFTINVVVVDNNFFLVVNKNKIKGVRTMAGNSKPFSKIELTKQ